MGPDADSGFVKACGEAGTGAAGIGLLSGPEVDAVVLGELVCGGEVGTDGCGWGEAVADEVAAVGLGAVGSKTRYFSSCVRMSLP